MKITKSHLKKIIKEEIKKIRLEGTLLDKIRSNLGLGGSSSSAQRGHGPTEMGGDLDKDREKLVNQINKFNKFLNYWGANSRLGDKRDPQSGKWSNDMYDTTTGKNAEPRGIQAWNFLGLAKKGDGSIFPETEATKIKQLVELLALIGTLESRFATTAEFEPDDEDLKDINKDYGDYITESYNERKGKSWRIVDDEPREEFKDLHYDLKTTLDKFIKEAETYNSQRNKPYQNILRKALGMLKDLKV